MKKAVEIKITYDDGSFDIAEGSDAESVWQELQSCEQLAWIHGRRYRGPQLRTEKANPVA